MYKLCVSVIDISSCYELDDGFIVVVILINLGTTQLVSLFSIT